MKLLIGTFMTVIAFNLLATEGIRLIKVKELGPMKNKVIFQSSEVKKIKKTNLVKGQLVAQWGVHVFEVVNGFYACNAQNVCKLADFERVATYESCKAVRKKFSCKGRISGDSSIVTQSDISMQDNPDEVSDSLAGSIVNHGPDSTEEDSRDDQNQENTWPVF